MGEKIKQLAQWLNNNQKKHPQTSFTYAVFKKYSDDEATYQAALMAYYGFMSLFPLLIVATAIVQIVTRGNEQLKELIISSMTSYFPSLGSTLTDSINTPSKSGLALFIGLFISFYGARGVANAVQHSLDHAWSVPRVHRAGFPRSMVRSFTILLAGGSGLVLAAVLNGYATASNHGPFLKLLLGTAGFATLFTVLWGVQTYGHSGRNRPHDNVPGALFAAVSILALQTIGSYIIFYQLKTQTGINAQFGVVISLLFWLYLHAQVFMLAAEVNTVKTYKLWPRSIEPEKPFVADREAYAMYRRRETFIDGKRVGH